LFFLFGFAGINFMVRQGTKRFHQRGVQVMPDWTGIHAGGFSLKADNRAARRERFVVLPVSGGVNQFMSRYTCDGNSVIEYGTDKNVSFFAAPAFAKPLFACAKSRHARETDRDFNVIRQCVTSVAEDFARAVHESLKPCFAGCVFGGWWHDGKRYACGFPRQQIQRRLSQINVRLFFNLV
jgi:hypothetical protein